MLLTCFLICFIKRLILNLFFKSKLILFSKKENLNFYLALLKNWMHIYFKLPKLFNCLIFNEIFNIWIHFFIIFIVKYSLKLKIYQLFFLSELNSLFYSSFLEFCDLFISPFYLQNALKYISFYIFDLILIMLI